MFADYRGWPAIYRFGEPQLSREENYKENDAI
jgi:hypothetical protein